MALDDLLNLSNTKKKIGLSEERIKAIIPVGKQYISYWRAYPDMFIDYLIKIGKLAGFESNFKFFFYQRVFLRIAVRYRQVYAVFPRGWSKSFIAVLSLMIRCILYPGAKLFTAAGGKSQSAGILKEKVDELCRLIPLLGNEIDRRPGKGTVEGKDKCVYRFKNGSYFDNVAANERTRGGRRHAGVLEECVGIDGDILQEVLIPMMSISRTALDGSKHPEETLNKSSLYITTAGYKATFPYNKLIEILVKMVTEPHGTAFVLGGTWRVPVMTGQYEKTFIQDQQRSGTFNETSFGREYESRWAGTAEGAFFSLETFERNRILEKPEYEYSGKSSRNAYYVLSCDVGRKGCASVVCVFKVTPQSQGPAIKTLVNLIVMEDEHFEDQAIRLKGLYYKYKARRLVIDGNGLGIGLIDYMIKSQTDGLGDYYPPFGIFNDEEGYYKKYRTNDTEDDAVYIIKANAPVNTAAHSAVQEALTSGKIKFLKDERVAREKLLGTKLGQGMTPEERNEYLMPYQLTSILRDEMLNLHENNEGVNIILKQSNKGIGKDKFSALEYGLYYIKQEEDSKKKKKKFNAKEWKFYTHGS